MHRARFAPILLAVALLATTGGTARAQSPVFRLSWDQCDPVITDKSWGGPGGYALQLSATGLSGSYSSLAFGIALSPATPPDAWGFYAIDFWQGAPGCQGASRLTAVPGGVGCATYPVTSVQSEMRRGSLTQPRPSGIATQLQFDPAFVADPLTRYGILRIVFDHSHSVAGPGGLGACGGAEQPVCFSANFTSLVDAQSAPRAVVYDASFVTWQDPSNTTDCPGSTPARARTWGAIKVQYR